MVKLALYDDALRTCLSPMSITTLPATPSSNNIVKLAAKIAAEYSEEPATQRRSDTTARALQMTSRKT